jgi:hypothetical protein
MNEEPRRKLWRNKWITRLLVALTLYAGSWGPVVALYDVELLHDPAPQWVMTFYWPLDRLSEHAPLQRPMQLYWYLWVRILKLV